MFTQSCPRAKFHEIPVTIEKGKATENPCKAGTYGSISGLTQEYCEGLCHDNNRRELSLRFQLPSKFFSSYLSTIWHQIKYTTQILW